MSLNTHGNALPDGYRLLWYRIGRALGQGGFGITYEALDGNLEKTVAIKEYLPREFAVREGDSTVRPFTEDRKQMFDWGLERFIQEARTLDKFKHSNIVQVYNVFEENGTAYMVMEFEQGEALDSLFRFGRLESEADLVRIAYPLLDGLDHMHQAGFIHRDIKPPNIYVRRDGSPVLLDFGSARFAIGGETKTLTSLVTPGFAPYEQYHNESGKQGPWTDIYGLGATLYAGLNRGRGPMDAIVRGNARIEGKPDPIEPAAELGKGRYSELFLHTIDAALGFTAEERPQTVAEWREMFPTLEEMAPSSPKRNPLADDAPTVIAKNTHTANTRDSSLTRGIDDDAMYASVWEEIESGHVDKGLWAKAYAQSGGDGEKTKATYLSLRVRQFNKAPDMGADIDEQQPKLNPIDSHDKDGYTPLMRAVMAMDVEAVKDLIAKGANPRILEENFHPSSALSMAKLHFKRAKTTDARECYQKILNILHSRCELQQHTELEKVEENEQGRHTKKLSETEMNHYFNVAKAGDWLAMRKLLDGGIDKNIQDVDGRTAIDIARSMNNIPMIDMLRSYGGERVIFG